MTDALTDAVRRLKELQQDVERIKSGENEEGQPRLLFSVQEQTITEDVNSVVGSDILNSEVVANDDALDIVGSDIANTETVAADDVQEDLRGRQIDDPATYNSVGYNTSAYNE
jgi:predicted membrane GTPase involved in stress response